jgi:hypothetical protein
MSVDSKKAPEKAARTARWAVTMAKVRIRRVEVGPVLAVAMSPTIIGFYGPVLFVAIALAVILPK